MPLGDERMTNGRDPLGTRQRTIVLNASQFKRSLFLPITESHDLQQCSMLFGEVLQLVVIQIATKPYGGQHQYLPVVESLAAAIGPRFTVDVCGDQIPYLAAAVDAAVGRWLARQRRSA